MSKRPGKILVVDDDKVVLRAVTEILQREGYTVVPIDDAVEGLAASKDPTVDVAVLDIRMPHLSGMDLLRAMKQSRPDVEVVMMTAFATVETATSIPSMASSLRIRGAPQVTLPRRRPAASLR